MSSQEPDKHEKTEEPTTFKLEEAKRKGSVFKSQEVNSLVALSMVLMFVYGLGEDFAYDALNAMRYIFMSAALNPQSEPLSLLQILEVSVLGTAMLVAPFAFMLLLTGLISNISQTGFIFTAEPLKPDFKRLDPVKGLKKIFSKRVLFELIKTLIKFSVFSLIIYYELKNGLEAFSSLVEKQPAIYLGEFIAFGGSLLFKLLIALLLVAVIDFMFSRWEYMKNMMMTRKELKDEIKRRDGDPHIKAKRRELEKELRKRSQSLDAVGGADLVITNPTHFAVVIKYDRTLMRAPVVVGKGADTMASAIRSKAYLYGVPVISSPALARHLYKKVSIDAPVPESTYQVVARLLHRAYQMRNESKAGLV